ncbi:MAG TPA: sigma 54-interacting transcriptional regulator [Candidatus Deferrimicrobium sp.]|nr:sigma 54-interacting transcriptional regulator [Candidatus Deferrimicrobium sp.]
MNDIINLEGNVPLDLLLNSTENAIIAIDCLGNIVYANKAVERVLGVNGIELIGELVSEYFPTTGLLHVLETKQPELAKKMVFRDRVLLSNRNPVFFEGNLIGAIAVFQDITVVQDFIDELIEEHERTKELKGTLEAVLDNAYEGLILVNKEGIITMTNQPFASFFNASPESLIGKPVLEVYDNPKFPEVLETGQAVYGYIHKLNGHEIIANRIPIRRNGEVVGALGKVTFKNVNELYSLADKVNALTSEVDYYKHKLLNLKETKITFDNIVSVNPKLRQLFDTAKKVALNNSTVLIRGESGTGKELIAQALYHESSRWKGPFVKVNCAAIPDTLLESELFGYVDGAFTGAKKGGQIGKFELADKGTIFLDEVGDMPLSMQAKLLRVLQEKEIERLGDNKSKKIDVRVIAATNRNLEELMKNKEFREDLYYRLNVIALNVPSLRERIDDIPALVAHFVGKFNHQFGAQVVEVDKEVLNLFKLHTWPGNVRELENVMERAFNVVDSEEIELKHLPIYLQTLKGRKSSNSHKGQSLASIVEEVEKEAIVFALAAAKGNKVQACHALGLSRSGLYKKLEKYNLAD